MFKKNSKQLLKNETFSKNENQEEKKNTRNYNCEDGKLWLWINKIINIIYIQKFK